MYIRKKEGRCPCRVVAVLQDVWRFSYGVQVGGHEKEDVLVCAVKVEVKIQVWREKRVYDKPGS